VAEAIHWTGGTLALLGALLTVAGAAGALRFPDVYTRIHAASLTDTGGATLMMLGLGLLAGLSLVTLKLALAWLFIMLTSPTAAHALANAAHGSGLRPQIGLWRIVPAQAEDGDQTDDGDGA